MLEMSTTRGVPFSPEAAAASRQITEARRHAEERRMADELRKQERREYGKMLDQIELCYRQHHVPQSERWH